MDRDKKSAEKGATNAGSRPTEGCGVGVKRPYRKPALRRLGTVRELTQATLSTDGMM